MRLNKTDKETERKSFEQNGETNRDSDNTLLATERENDILSERQRLKQGHR